MAEGESNSDEPLLRGTATRRGAAVYTLVRTLSLSLLLIITIALSLKLPAPLSWLFRFGVILFLTFLVSTIATLTRHAVEFELFRDRVRYRRLGHRLPQEVPLEDISAVIEWSDHVWSGSSTVHVCDGSNFVLQPRILENSAPLIEVLRRCAHADQEWLVGTPDVTKTTAMSGSRFLLRSISSFGIAFAVIVFFVGTLMWQRQFANPWPFYLLGAIFLVIGVWGIIANSGPKKEIVWFELNENQLRYKVFGSRRLFVTTLDDIQSVSRNEVAVRPEPKWQYHLALRDGRSLVLDAQTVSNAAPLAARIYRHTIEQLRQTSTIEPIRFPENAERLSRINAVLEPGEKCLWIGAAKPRNEQFLFSVLSIVLGLIFVAVIVLTAPKQRPGTLISGILLAGIAILFIGTGVQLLMRARRNRPAIQNALYAVTDRRGLILNGVLHPWMELEGSDVRSLGPKELQNYDLRGQRHVVFGSTKRRVSGLGEMKLTYGFIACDDAANAVRAIDWLLDQHGLLESRLSLTNVTQPSMSTASR